MDINTKNALLGMIPIIVIWLLIGVVFLLPLSTREQLALDADNPRLVKAYTASVTHFRTDHYLRNAFLFIILGILQFLLARELGIGRHMLIGNILIIALVPITTFMLFPPFALADIPLGVGSSGFLAGWFWATVAYAGTGGTLALMFFVLYLTASFLLGLLVLSAWHRTLALWIVAAGFIALASRLPQIQSWAPKGKAGRLVYTIALIAPPVMFRPDIYQPAIVVHFASALVGTFIAYLVTKRVIVNKMTKENL